MNDLDQVDRDALLIWLADNLENHLDLGFHYRASDRTLGFVRNRRELVIAAAEGLGFPSLARALREAYAETDSAHIPPEFRKTREGVEYVVSRGFRRVVK